MEFHLKLIEEFEKYEQILTEEEKSAFLSAGIKNTGGFLYTMGGYIRENILLENQLAEHFLIGGLGDLMEMTELFLKLFYIYLNKRHLLDDYSTYYI